MKKLASYSTVAGALALLLLAAPSQAGLRCEIGLLTAETLAGDNPATGRPWRAGDTYRFAFHSNAETGLVTGNETSIGWYDAFVQNLANESRAYPISADHGVIWKVIGSTSAVDARDHTSTNPAVEPGCAIYLLDGSTLVARNNAELWSGTIRHIINITERGETWTNWPYTGTLSNGTKRTGGHQNRPLGTGTTGQGNAVKTSQWVYRGWTGSDKSQPLYALSEPLMIEAPSVSMISMK